MVTIDLLKCGRRSDCKKIWCYTFMSITLELPDDENSILLAHRYL